MLKHYEKAGVLWNMLDDEFYMTIPGYCSRFRRNMREVMDVVGDNYCLWTLSNGSKVQTVNGQGLLKLLRRHQPDEVKKLANSDSKYFKGLCGWSSHELRELPRNMVTHAWLSASYIVGVHKLPRLTDEQLDEANDALLDYCDRKGIPTLFRVAIDEYCFPLTRELLTESAIIFARIG